MPEWHTSSHSLVLSPSPNELGQPMSRLQVSTALTPASADVEPPAGGGRLGDERDLHVNALMI